MKVKYRSHAVDRMLQRGISTTEVETILKSPDGKIQQSQDKYIFYKRLKNRADNLIAAVTLVKLRNEYEVITVMIDFEVHK